MVEELGPGFPRDSCVGHLLTGTRSSCRLLVSHTLLIGVRVFFVFQSG